MYKFSIFFFALIFLISCKSTNRHQYCEFPVNKPTKQSQAKVYAIASELAYVHTECCKKIYYEMLNNMQYEVIRNTYCCVECPEEKKRIDKRLFCEHRKLDELLWEEFRIKMCDYPSLKNEFIILRHFERKNEYILAFKGSKHFYLDWVRTDAIALLGFLPSRYIEAERLVNRLFKKNKNLTLTGHSLGGGMAVYAAQKHGVNAVVFNSAYMSHRSLLEKDTNSRIVEYRNFYDPLLLLRAGGNYQTSKIYTICTEFRCSFHSIENLISDLTCINGGYLNPLIFDKENQEKNRMRKNGDLARNLFINEPMAFNRLPNALRNTFSSAVIRENNAAPIIIRSAFRVGVIADTEPSGGININSMRLLDLSSIKKINSKEDIARDFRMALGFSGQLCNKSSWIFNVDYKELDYDIGDDFDNDILDMNLGLSFDLGKNHFLAISGLQRRLRIQDEQVGKLYGLNVSYGAFFDFGVFQKGSLFWLHGMGGNLKEAASSGGDGTVIEGDIGIRAQITPKSSYQFRFFGGHRDGENELFTNTQWGVGFGYYRKFDWLPSSILIEPFLRWTKHKVDFKENNDYTDKEYLLNIEYAFPLNFKLFNWGEVRDWFCSVSYTFSHNNASINAQDYERHQIGLQFEKTF